MMCSSRQNLPRLARRIECLIGLVRDQRVLFESRYALPRGFEIVSVDVEFCVLWLEEPQGRALALRIDFLESR